MRPISREMAARAQAPPVDYLARTRELPVNLLFLMPWILVYELCLVGTRSPVENAAAAWLRTLVHTLGPDGLVAVTLLVSLLLCVVVLLRIKEAARDRGVYGGMLLEGLLYGALLGFVARVMADSLPLGRMVPLAITDGASMEGMRASLQSLGLAVGAGVFEEILFRALLLAGLYGLLRHGLGMDKVTGAVIAILASAWVFSAYHHWGPGAEAYHASVFAFRFWAGVALGAVFLMRGLGIAAFTHGFYDALVLVLR